MVDTVSSLAGVKIEVDKLGIDICLASVQKALAIPPGLSVFSISGRAFEKCKQAENKGYYFNLEIMMKYHLKNQTPSTPPIPQIYALNHQLKRIFDEGLDERFDRHRDMAMFTREWAEKRFELYPEKGFESVTMSCIRNTKNIDIPKLNDTLMEKGCVISNGYGKLKGLTFRIAHMGDTRIEEISHLLTLIDKAIA